MANGEPVPPRSYADLGVEVLQTLGKLGPVTIIVGGILVAVYFFYQALSDAQLKADEQNQKKLDAAQAALVKTYESISALSQKQIANVEKMLVLHDKVATATETRREQLEKLQDKAEKDAEAIRAEANAAKSEADAARTEANAAKALADAARAEAKALKAAAKAARDEAETAKEEAKAALALAETAKEESAALRAGAEALRTEATEAQGRANAAQALVDAAKAEAEALRSEAMAARTEADTARKLAEQAKTEVEALQADASQMALRREIAQQALEKLESNTAKLKMERDQVQEDLVKRRELLEARAKRIEQLEATLSTLANEVASSGGGGQGADDKGAQLAQEILEKDESLLPRNLLVRAAAGPSQESFEALDALDGIKDEALRPLLDEGVGFEGWMQFGLSDDHIAYIGTLSSERTAYISPVLIELEGGRVIDVFHNKRIFSVRTQDVTNWQNAKVITFFQFYDGELDPTDQFVIDAQQDFIDLETVFSSGVAPGFEFSMTKVFGDVPPLDFMTLEDFKGTYPEAYEELREENGFGSEIELASRMRDRARSFQPDNLRGLHHLQPFDGLYEPFAGLTAAAVARDLSAYDYLTPYAEADAVGRVAAAVLSDDFSISAATNISPVPSELQQQQPKTDNVWIIATSLSSHEQDVVQRYTFEFTLLSDPIPTWALADFRVESDND